MAEGGYFTRGKKRRQEEMDRQRQEQREQERETEAKRTYVRIQRIVKA